MPFLLISPPIYQTIKLSKKETLENGFQFGSQTGNRTRVPFVTAGGQGGEGEMIEHERER